AVVPSRAEQRPGLGARIRRADARADDVLQQRIAEQRGRGVHLARGPAQAAAPHDGVELGRDAGPRRVARAVELAAQVDAEPRLARHDVDGAGERLEPADRADDVVLARADPLDREGRLARPEQRVAAHVVGRAARVPGLALDDDLEAPGRGDRRHDRERLAAAVELDALLDVGLEVADEALARARRLAHALGVEPEGAVRLAQRDAVRVGQIPPAVLPRA